METEVLRPRQHSRCYAVYVLVILLVAYLLNQLDRYLLSIVTMPMAQEIHYGDLQCLHNKSFLGNHSAPNSCQNGSTETRCSAIVDKHGQQECEWNYNGQGFQYQLLAGPIFIVIYTLVGIPLGFLSDLYNRKALLAICVTFWSLMTLLSGLVQEYWQLALLRFGLGIGEAGCTPFATALIADYFGEESRGLALGVYNWGIYVGYSLAYAVGNFVTKADILGQGWRWAFYIGGMPGLLLGPLILATVAEPRRQTLSGRRDAEDFKSLLGHREEEARWYHKLRVVVATFCSPSLLLLCLAGSVRNAAGYVWAYNTQPYYQSLGQTPEEIAYYMSWIPLVGGIVGVLLGGFISDRVVKRVGPHARLLVLVVSQVVASPFVAGALYLSPPWAYLSLLPGYIAGEMWVSIALAVLVELVPTPLRASSVAVYLFIISNIGGNVPLLVPPLTQAFQSHGFHHIDALRAALYVLYPGLYVLGAVLFLITMFSLKRDLERVRRDGYQQME